MGLVEVHGKKTILKTGETEDKLSCPDKDFDAQADGDTVTITPLRSMKTKKVR